MYILANFVFFNFYTFVIFVFANFLDQREPGSIYKIGVVGNNWLVGW